ncbi:hypothetical protein D922_02423, partial [Enterococcus faecalis 06-MB-DW-09]
RELIFLYHGFSFSYRRIGRLVKRICDHGYGEPDGTQGINYRHRLYNQIYDPDLDVHMKQYDPKQAIDNADLVAKQRRMEVANRRAKRQLNAAITIDKKEGVRHFKQLIR